MDQAPLIRLRVNGEDRTLPEGSTVATLLAAIGLAERKVAVERNAEIVPRSLYATTRLAAGDALEIVHFIGGG